MEVFSISGFGAASCPAGWTATPNGNCGGAATAGYRHPAAVALQQALNTAGAGLSVDGVIGPKTTSAVNKLLNVNLSTFQAAEQAATLADKVRAGVSTAVAAKKAGASPAQAAAAATKAVQAVGPAPVSVGTGLSTAGGWALVGLNVIVAGIGGYFTYTK